MPAAADWITLAEAAEILAAANVRFRPETIGAWARSGKLSSIKLEEGFSGEGNAIFSYDLP